MFRLILTLIKHFGQLLYAIFLFVSFKSLHDLRTKVYTIWSWLWCRLLLLLKRFSRYFLLPVNLLRTTYCLRLLFITYCSLWWWLSFRWRSKFALLFAFDNIWSNLFWNPIHFFLHFYLFWCLQIIQLCL